ncbi:transglycosylase family protein [Streptomyces sp. NBC_01190]|uniref:transglycosylase family protein n=1 Tax=Streptomyces sp. NBC_01190 TaxID=2903767 RepID=UPI0038671715|nr:transglycosylase family protein [Streptomyces sp. NBC_01190]
MLSSGNGRHRRPRPTPAAVVTMATAAATGAGIALPLFGAATAQAADPSTWDRVAFCETGGLWQANTGNGFYGGLAITQDTWDQYGGDAYAKRPDLATEAQQIAVAEKMLTNLGPGAWPGCEEGTGLLPDSPPTDPTAAPTPAQPGEHTPAPTPDPSAPVATPTAPTADPSAPATTPGVPVTPTTPPTTGMGNPGDPSDPGDPATDPTTPVTPSTPRTPAPPATVTPPPATPGSGASTLAPTDSSGATVAPPDASSGTGRHAKPYSPTDEELAAQDQATRTQVFAIADGGPASPTATDTTNKGEDSRTSPTGHYTIGAGDSLSGIARAERVDGGWRHLYDVNRQAIGANPNLIKPGQIINLD